MWGWFRDWCNRLTRLFSFRRKSETLPTVTVPPLPSRQPIPVVDEHPDDYNHPDADFYYPTAEDIEHYPFYTFGHCAAEHDGRAHQQPWRLETPRPRRKFKRTPSWLETQSD